MAVEEGAGPPVDVDRWVASLAERAATELPAEVVEYVLQGARHGITAAEATRAWARVRVWPRVLRDVSAVDLTTQLLGARAAAPWGVAPTTHQRAVHPGGEVAMAAGCAEAGVPVVVSSNAGSTFADVAATGADWWLQVYLPRDRRLAEPLLERAVAAGARAVVLTVDTPVVGTKHAAGDRTVWDVVDPALLRVNFDPSYAAAPGAAKATDLVADDIDWLATRTGVPVVVKGVLDPRDAVDALRAGARGVWVSNHGGRQLDRVVASAEALPEVAAAVHAEQPGAGRPRAEVYADGGVRGGLDVLAALALGADAVFLGRPAILALQDGADGVALLHRALVAEVVEALRLAGCRRPEEARALRTTTACHCCGGAHHTPS